jgi:hypothetical protein
VSTTWFKYCKTGIPMGRDIQFGRDEMVHYYYAQAVFTLMMNPEFNARSEGIRWSEYRNTMFDHLQSSQNNDGSWLYGDTMHAAPPPTRDDLPIYRVSAVTGFARPGARPHRGRNYNEVLHRREDGQIEHLGSLAERETGGRTPR